MRKIALQSHVVALKFFEPYFLLEGCGGFLSVYNLNDRKLLDTIDLFDGARIHGIQIADRRDALILSYGGKQLAVLQCSSSSKHFKLSLVIKIHESDWIQDCRFVNNNELIVTLSSHNKLSVWKYEKSEIIHSFQCKEQCILYSGQILGNRLDDLVVLSGTVFGDVLIWTANIEQNSTSILHRLQGSKGAVFSVRFERSCGIILSTSDDRALRTWKLDNGQYENDKENLSSYFQQAQCALVHELYGHEARVWRSRVIRDRTGLEYIVSFGEDSRICLWNLRTGKLLSHFQAHQGASIWAAEWIPCLNILITGGGDGSLQIWNPEGFWDFNIHPLKLTAKEVPRIIATLGNRLLLTNEGNIYSWNQDHWNFTYGEELLKRISVLRFNPDGRFLICGTLCGSVIIFSVVSDNGVKLDLLVRLQIIQSKIFNLHFVNSEQFLVCLEQGRMQLRSFSGLISEYILPPCKQRWIACGLLVGLYLIVGDRDGSLHVYLINEKVSIQCFPNIHGKHGVTDICCDPVHKDIIFSTGKDGMIRTWRLNKLEHVSGIQAGNWALELLNVTQTGLGWISRLFWIQSEMVYLAFHGANFIVWSPNQQRALMETLCGGGHRSWDFEISQNNFIFTFIKDKQVYESRIALDCVLNSTLKTGGHTRAVGVAKFVKGPDEQIMLVTGSEDTTIKTWSVSSKSFLCLNTIHKHISSIRAISMKTCKSFKRDVDDVVMISAGGRAQMNVTTYQFTNHSPNQNLIYRDVRSHFLRGYIHRRSDHKPWLGNHSRELVPDPETRYMDVDVMEYDNNEIYIVAACSDGIIRIFELTIESSRLELMMELPFHHCCVLKVKVVKMGEYTALISAATNGSIAFWNISSLSEEAHLYPIAHRQIHQSGINSLSVHLISSTKLLLVTGGDDNALTCTLLETDSRLNSAQLTVKCQVTGHAAQISGVSVLPNDRILSVSLDQRLVLWKLDANSWNLHMESVVCCDVPDIQGLDVLIMGNQVLICIYGQGLQLLTSPI